MATTLTTPTTVYFLERPHPTLAGESDGNYPYHPNYRLFFRETPPPPLKQNLMATTLTTPTTVCFLKRPHPHSVFILCAWYTIWVSIPIKSHVLSLFLAFITLSDLYYSHHPPSEECTFRRQKKGNLYIQILSCCREPYGGL